MNELMLAPKGNFSTAPVRDCALFMMRDTRRKLDLSEIKISLN
jgi:hypothetical protein